MRPIMPRTTSEAPAVMALRQTRFVRPQHLLLVEGSAGHRDLPGQQPNVPGPAGAVQRMLVGNGRDVEALPDQRAETLRRKDGRLVRRGVASGVHADEERATVGEDPVHLVEASPR